jgi:hypothetical protein
MQRSNAALWAACFATLAFFGTLLYLSTTLEVPDIFRRRLPM